MENLVFINYRRDDSGSEAKLIADGLRSRVAFERVFIDTSSIAFGEPWPDWIASALETSRFVLIVIGPEWLRAGSDKWGVRRIDSDTDWVRNEIAAALRDVSKVIIPVLVRGACMPPKEVLPVDIADVTTKQCVALRADFWEHDIRMLYERVFDAEVETLGADELRGALPLQGSALLNNLLGYWLTMFTFAEGLTSNTQDIGSQVDLAFIEQEKKKSLFPLTCRNLCGINSLQMWFKHRVWLRFQYNYLTGLWLNDDTRHVGTILVHIDSRRQQLRGMHLGSTDGNSVATGLWTWIRIEHLDEGEIETKCRSMFREKSLPEILEQFRTWAQRRSSVQMGDLQW